MLSALSGLELFGQERENIEVFKVLRGLGAVICVGVNAMEDGADVGRCLRGQGFATFPVPFGTQWSWQWLKQDPISLFSKARAVARCSRIFRRRASDLRPTHILLGNPLVYSYLSLSLETSRVPLIYRMGDCPPFDSPFNLCIWRLAMRKASHVVAVSEFVRREAISGGVPASRLSMIYNLSPPRKDPPDRSTVGSPMQGTKVQRIVYVGAVAEHKGVRELVLALALLSRQFPDLALDIVGGSRYDASFRGQIRALIHDKGLAGRVVMHGYLDDPTLFYRNADIHVAPSLCPEALGSVVLEAKREGVPSVVFRSGGLPEIVRHGVDGLICEERTPEALAAGIASLLNDAAGRRAKGRAACEDIDARFGPERFARQWAEVFLQLPGTGPSDGTNHQAGAHAR